MPLNADYFLTEHYKFTEHKTYVQAALDILNPIDRVGVPELVEDEIYVSLETNANILFFSNPGPNKHEIELTLSFYKFRQQPYNCYNYDCLRTSFSSLDKPMTPQLYRASAAQLQIMKLFHITRDKFMILKLIEPMLEVPEDVAPYLERVYEVKRKNAVNRS